MRKIKTREEIERRERKNRIIIGVVLVTMLVLATAGYAFFDNDDETPNSVNVKGLKFFKSGESWLVSISDQTFKFSYLPDEVSNVSVMGDYYLGNYSQQPLYFVGEEENYYGQVEVLQNLGRYVLRYQDACIKEFGCSGDLPIKNCSSDNLIIFAEANKTEIYSDDKCVYILGDAIRGADAFIYTLFGIN